MSEPSRPRPPVTSRVVTWPAALLAFFVSHVVGDVLLQTEWQARNKARGLGDALGRRALARHVTMYTLAFVPALVWIGAETSAQRAIGIGLLVAVPHLLVDDGRGVHAWVRVAKRVDGSAPALVVAVDQSFHVVCLFGAALLAAA